MDSDADICEDCSGHGSCVKESFEKCECDDGWGLINCAITTEEVEKLRDSLDRIITVIYDNFDVEDLTDAQFGSALQIIEYVSSISARSEETM